MEETAFFVFALGFFLFVVNMIASDSRRDDDRARNDMREFGAIVGRRSKRRNIFR